MATTISIKEKLTELFTQTWNAVVQNFVPKTRKVNNKPLSADITLTATDVGAATTAQGELADTALQPGDVNDFDDSAIQTALAARYTKTETDGAISTAVGTENTRALAAESALSAKVTTHDELLDGATGALQLQINGLKDRGEYFGSYATNAALLAATGMKVNSYATVRADETLSGKQRNATAQYKYDGEEWIFDVFIEFVARDFAAEKISTSEIASKAVAKAQLADEVFEQVSDDIETAIDGISIETLSTEDLAAILVL